MYSFVTRARTFGSIAKRAPSDGVPAVVLGVPTLLAMLSVGNYTIPTNHFSERYAAAEHAVGSPQALCAGQETILTIP